MEPQGLEEQHWGSGEKTTAAPGLVGHPSVNNPHAAMWHCLLTAYSASSSLAFIYFLWIMPSALFFHVSAPIPAQHLHCFGCFQCVLLIPGQHFNARPTDSHAKVGHQRPKDQVLSHSARRCSGQWHHSAPSALAGPWQRRLSRLLWPSRPYFGEQPTFMT